MYVHPESNTVPCTWFYYEFCAFKASHVKPGHERQNAFFYARRDIWCQNSGLFIKDNCLDKMHISLCFPAHGIILVVTVQLYDKV